MKSKRINEFGDMDTTISFEHFPGTGNVDQIVFGINQKDGLKLIEKSVKYIEILHDPGAGEIVSVKGTVYYKKSSSHDRCIVDDLKQNINKVEARYRLWKDINDAHEDLGVLNFTIIGVDIDEFLFSFERIEKEDMVNIQNGGNGALSLDIITLNSSVAIFFLVTVFEDDILDYVAEE